MFPVGHPGIPQHQPAPLSLTSCTILRKPISRMIKSVLSVRGLTFIRTTLIRRSGDPQGHWSGGSRGGSG